ncbi:MAG: DUF488 domain-containing protein [Prevotella sp.]|jgi:uncharacterized protein YeaO (DUF488 family)
MDLTIQLKRVYEPAEESDGLRILVDRVWPRGVKKSELKYDIWAKDVTPSIGLRHFFHENPYDNWDKFAEEYRMELSDNEAVDRLVMQICESGFHNVTLLYGFRNPVKNHAVILRDVLKTRISIL